MSYPKTPPHRPLKAWSLAAGTVIAVLTAAAIPIATHATSAHATEAKTARVVVEVPGVGCANCTPEVRRALKSAGGVTEIEEGSPRSRIIVTYEVGPNRPALYLEALRKAGFEKAYQVTTG